MENLAEQRCVECGEKYDTPHKTDCKQRRGRVLVKMEDVEFHPEQGILCFLPKWAYIWLCVPENRLSLREHLLREKEEKRGENRTEEREQSDHPGS